MLCRRARSSASRSPRLVGLSACNSSRMTVSSPARKRGASACESSSAICSGVVSRMSGGRARWRCLREAEVSPVRVSTRIGSCICSSGVSRLRATSTASAFSGDTYSVCTLRSPLPLASGQRHQARQEAGQRLARPGRRDQQGRAARGGLLQQGDLVLRAAASRGCRTRPGRSAAAGAPARPPAPRRRAIVAANRVSRICRGLPCTRCCSAQAVT